MCSWMLDELKSIDSVIKKNKQEMLNMDLTKIWMRVSVDDGAKHLTFSFCFSSVCGTYPLCLVPAGRAADRGAEEW